MPSPRRRLVVLAPAIVLAMWAAFQVGHVTRHDLGTTPDSATYLGTADNLRHGHGPTVPFTFLWDGNGAAVRAFQAPSTSYIAVLDDKGRVVYTGVGADQEIESALEKAVGGGKGAVRGR